MTLFAVTRLPLSLTFHRNGKGWFKNGKNYCRYTEASGLAIWWGLPRGVSGHVGMSLNRNVWHQGPLFSVERKEQCWGKRGVYLSNYSPHLFIKKVNNAKDPWFSFQRKISQLRLFHIILSSRPCNYTSLVPRFTISTLLHSFLNCF